MKFLPLLLSLYIIIISGYGQSKTYSFVFLNKKTSPQELPKEEAEKIMEGHMANIERLSKEGKLIIAGPFEGGGGIFILNTASINEAKEWLSTDPGVQANRWDVEILPYTPRIGAVCRAQEPYEMVTYHFIRFTQNSNSANNDVSQIMKQHQEYLQSLSKTEGVIAEGIFSGTGSILISKGDLNNNLFDSDPAVKQGIVLLNAKKLWIAKGSFCEQ